MPRPPEASACSRVADLLDALPDGELSSVDLAFLNRHTAGCPACAMERELALEVAQGLARLPRFSCPPAVSASVARAAERDAAARPTLAARVWRVAAGKLARNLTIGSLWRPALATGAAALLAVALIVSRRPEPAPAYSREQVAQAQAQLELAFAYLGRMGRETGTLVQQELVDHLVKPAFRVMGPAGLGTEGTR